MELPEVFSFSVTISQTSYWDCLWDTPEHSCAHHVVASFWPLLCGLLYQHV